MANTIPVLCGLLSAALITLSASVQAQSPVADPTNEAFITQLGQNQRAAIEQRNVESGLLSGAITQSGTGNEASILMEGGDLSGGILQQGNGNAASLEIRDRDNRGVIEQYNDANSAALKIEGEGKDVTLIQNGGVQNQGVPITVGGDAPAGQPIIIRQY